MLTIRLAIPHAHTHACHEKMPTYPLSQPSGTVQWILVTANAKRAPCMKTHVRISLPTKQVGNSLMLLLLLPTMNSKWSPKQQSAASTVQSAGMNGAEFSRHRLCRVFNASHPLASINTPLVRPATSTTHGPLS